ncbi:beta-1,3-galactosyltransferase 1-like, partial [Centruroides sculpturatus]|uniref:beta-1,3-galactosyltransferase 1-like n=1 Tax=Centruroides sculpturatus TaxID=218467 RepID=UPI000C6EB312
QVLRCSPKTKVAVVNPHDFPYVINQPGLCSDSRRFLIIFVTSRAVDEDKRRAIRETWGSKEELKKVDTVLAFVVGNPGQERQQKQLEEESKIYKDILQEDFVDVYSNLTLKTVMALKWTTLHCKGVEFVMKTDNDIFVNVPYLVDFLKNVNKSRWIAGCVKDHAKQPFRMKHGKMEHVPSLIRLHPIFVAGAGYVISRDLVEPLYRTSLRTRYYPIEDVYVTGKCARAIGVYPEHDQRFSCGELVTHNCAMFTRFTGHRVTPERQHWIWQDLKHSCNHERVS